MRSEQRAKRRIGSAARRCAVGPAAHARRQCNPGAAADAGHTLLPEAQPLGVDARAVGGAIEGLLDTGEIVTGTCTGAAWQPACPSRSQTVDLALVVA
jgi:hypothetical protein